MPIYIDCKYGHMIDIDYSWPELRGQDPVIDVNAAIDIRKYTSWILGRQNPEADAEVIDSILEIRGWFWERHLMEASSAECSKQHSYHKSITGHDMRKIIKDYIEPKVDSLGLGISEG